MNIILGGLVPNHLPQSDKLRYLHLDNPDSETRDCARRVGEVMSANNAMTNKAAAATAQVEVLFPAIE